MPALSDRETTVAKMRKRASLTVEEMAEALHVSTRSAYRYESGESSPSPLAMDKLRSLGDAQRIPETMAKFRFIDLFAGIGGLRVGFENIGGKCVFTSEWDRFAAETYRRNFSDGEEHIFAGDIREYTSSPETLALIPEHDVLLAGFPGTPKTEYVLKSLPFGMA